jgi:hypothetical protein
LSGEHTLLTWLDKVFPEVFRRQGVYKSGWEGDASSARTWIITWQEVIDQKVAAVCIPCTARWMSPLEAAVVPIIGPMARGEGPLKLLPEAQRCVAFWLAKTACVIDLVDHPRTIPPEHYRLIYKCRSKRELPGGMRVWIGASAYPPNQQMFLTHFHRTTEPPQPPTQPYVFTMYVGHLLARIVFDPGDRTLYDRDDAHVATIWPTVHSAVAWPPRPILDRDALDSLVRIISNEPPQSP